MTETTFKNVDDIIHIYTNKGKDLYYEESMSQLEHSLQAAAYAMDITENEDLVAAALLHDIGHLIENEHTTEIGNIDHDQLGAEYLTSLGFPYSITHLVAHHVKAKRYLVTTQSDYLDSLSVASKKTLELQGGLMSEDELNAFESDPLLDDIITIRICDDKAKGTVPSRYLMGDFRQLLISVLDKTKALTL